MDDREDGELSCSGPEDNSVNEVTPSSDPPSVISSYRGGNTYNGFSTQASNVTRMNKPPLCYNSSDSSSESDDSEDENCHLKALKKKRKVIPNENLERPAFSSAQQISLKKEFEQLQNSIQNKSPPQFTDGVPPPPPPAAVIPKRKRNNIWANVLNEQVLTDDVIAFGLKKLDGDRKVENYDYKAVQAMRQEEEEGELEECIQEVDEEEEGEMVDEENSIDKTEFVKNRLSRKRPRKNHNSYNHMKFYGPEAELGEPINLPTLPEDTESLSDEKLGLIIAECLSEQKTELIHRVISVLGRDEVVKAFKATCTEESAGGLAVMNGGRRRTSGGVFIQIIKQTNLSKEDTVAIFPKDQEHIMWKKRKRAHTRRKNRDALVAEGAASITSSSSKISQMEDGEDSNDARTMAGSKCPGSTPVTSPVGSPVPTPTPTPVVTPHESDGEDIGKDEITEMATEKCNSISNEQTPPPPQSETELTVGAQEEMDVA